LNDFFFHLVFIFVFLSFTLIRARYQRLAMRTQGRVEYIEGKLHRALRLAAGIPFIGAVFASMAWPSLLSFARLDLPAWLQWAGVLLGLASLPLIGWVQSALGSNFSTTLHVREEHTLVTRGPYRWVRHPMYTVLYIHLVSLFLLTENWMIGGIFLLSLTLIVGLRIRKEEATMVDKFGDAYLAYMQRTGRFLPRLIAG
jgi:protein-S-isoprenylcysteine O-methyltransferase Ste14